MARAVPTVELIVVAGSSPATAFSYGRVAQLVGLRTHIAAVAGSSPASVKGTSFNGRTPPSGGGDSGSNPSVPV